MSNQKLNEIRFISDKKTDPINFTSIKEMKPVWFVSDNPVKVKKQHFGLFGQPLVVDLDKIEVMNDGEPIVKVTT